MNLLFVQYYLFYLQIHIMVLDVNYDYNYNFYKKVLTNRIFLRIRYKKTNPNAKFS